MGGCKTYGGRKTYHRTRSPENFWTPPKELLVYSVVDFCTGKTEHWHLRGVENVPYEGGSKTPFWEGCHSWGFPPPSFFHPPHGVLWWKFRSRMKISSEPPTAALFFCGEFEISSEIENFEREWEFRASHRPRPYFCGEFETSRLKFSSEIKNFERDCNFVWLLGPLGFCLKRLLGKQKKNSKYRWGTPFVGGRYRTSTLHALQGGNAQKRGRGYHTQLAMLRQQKPHSVQ